MALQKLMVPSSKPPGPQSRQCCFSYRLVYSSRCNFLWKRITIGWTCDRIPDIDERGRNKLWTKWEHNSTASAYRSILQCSPSSHLKLLIKSAEIWWVSNHPEGDQSTRDNLFQNYVLAKILILRNKQWAWNEGIHQRNVFIQVRHCMPLRAPERMYSGSEPAYITHIIPVGKYKTWWHLLLNDWGRLAWNIWCLFYIYMYKHMLRGASGMGQVMMAPLEHIDFEPCMDHHVVVCRARDDNGTTCNSSVFWVHHKLPLSPHIDQKLHLSG